MSETQSARSRRRARGRPAFRVDADHGALVPARRRARDRRDPRCARLGLGAARSSAAGRCSTSASRSRPRAAARSRASRRTRRRSARSSARRLRCERASAASGLTLGQLRGNVTSAAVVSAGQGKNVTPLVEITVDAAAGRKAEKAANSLADIGHRASSRPTSTRRSRSSTSRSPRARPSSPTSTSASRTPSQQQQAVINDKTHLVDRQADRDQHLQQHDQLLRAAPRHRPAGAVPEPAAALAGRERREEQDRAAGRCASKTTATSRRNSALIGALIGLLLGALAAAVADPFLQRRAARSAA